MLHDTSFKIISQNNILHEGIACLFQHKIIICIDFPLFSITGLWHIYISVYKLVTLSLFCISRSQMYCYIIETYLSLCQKGNTSRNTFWPSSETETAWGTMTFPSCAMTKMLQICLGSHFQWELIPATSHLSESKLIRVENHQTSFWETLFVKKWLQFEMISIVNGPFFMIYQYICLKNQTIKTNTQHYYHLKYPIQFTAPSDFMYI